MKRLLFALLALTLSTPVFAQAWNTGPRTVTYSTGQIGDGSTSYGGTPPAYASETAGIDDTAAGYDLANWTSTTGTDRISAVTAGEEKVRFVCNSSHVAQEDPILFPGQALTGHWHEFVGNTQAGKDSTYTTLRMTGASTCPGAAANRTAYWKPAVMKKLPTGLVSIIRSDYEQFYYAHAVGKGITRTRIPNDFAFIGGVNPADPTNATRRAELPSGYAISNSGPNGDGFLGWKCLLSGGSYATTVDGGVYYPALQTGDGNDPWSGACVQGSQLEATVIAPQCWDGHNPKSPDGRSHVRYTVRNTATGTDDICPDGWWKVMSFIGASFYGVGEGGWNDYRYWYLSSDRHGLTSANWRTPGSTFHFDWMNGWEPDAINRWQAECGGVTNVPGIAASPAACNSSTIGINLRLLSVDARPSCTGCAALANNPITDPTIRHQDDGTGRFYPLEAGMDVEAGHFSHGG